MTLGRYVQEFTDQETGQVQGVTFEAIELWTEAGWEVIPAGFQFTAQTIPKQVRKLLKDEEIPLCILREWHRTARIKPDRATERAFRRELIKYQQKRKGAKKGRFWRFVKDRARLEVISLMVRAFGIIQRWHLFRI
jgi:hypothetical protein